MSTKNHSSDIETALASIPSRFRPRIIKYYVQLKRNCLESRYEAAGMSAAKFCEVILRFLQHAVTGTNIPFGNNIGNFADECRKLVTAPEGATKSERLIIPRALVFLYTMRSNRDIGHVGGDVDANAIDIATMARVADWVVCELIRVYHGLSLEEAQDFIDGMSVRQLPFIWEVNGKKRVLVNGLRYDDKALLLLHSSLNASVLIEDLCDWLEYSNLSVFKSKVIRPLHKARLVEYDENVETVTLSPTGTGYVESKLLPTIQQRSAAEQA